MDGGKLGSWSKEAMCVLGNCTRPGGEKGVEMREVLGSGEIGMLTTTS